MTTKVFIYLWCLPITADCKHCKSSTKVFRHARNRPHDAFYICNVGRSKFECGSNASPSPAEPPPEEPKQRVDVIGKRGDANLTQDEIDAMLAANKT